MRILFLDLDTLRPDHLGCYGYHRNTSPNIDRIAEEGTVYENYYCSDAPCLPSRTALMTGRFGIHTGVVNHGGAAAAPVIQGPDRGFKDRLAQEALPMIFRRKGMKAVSISPFAERHSAWAFNAGFTEIHNTGRSGGESAEEITPTVLKWIESNAQEDDWFLHVNYWDAHTPYRAPEKFGNPFENDPLPDWFTKEKLAEHNKMPGPHNSLEIMMYHDRENPRFPRQPGKIKDMKSLRRMIDGYDCGIAYMDSHIGQLFNAFEEAGVMDQLVVIVSADHGENHGELGLYGEHGTADHITCRIPMIIRWPGMQKGHRDKGLHYNLDLPPTLAELLDTEPRPDWDGQSYAASLTDGDQCGRDQLVISQCCHVCQRGVRFGPWLYMRTYHDGYHLFPGEMLFNIEEDPHEEHNLAEEHPELCREAAHRLLSWHDKMMMTMDSAVDPMWTVMREGGPFHANGHLKQYCEHLRKTGRAFAIPELKRRHPGEFK